MTLDQTCDGATVVMRCPECGKTKDALRHASDPPDCALIVLACADCSVSVGELAQWMLARYFDADGKEIGALETP